MTTSTQHDEHDRIASERDFHNKRFTEETRERFHPMYRTVEHGFAYYRQLIEQRAAGKDVLEYGCATGRKSLKLAPNSKSVTGIDLSDVAIEQANQAAKDAGLANASFHAMNAEEMEFPSESFDFVFGSSILHHLVLERAYSEVARVLRPGGSALFLEPLGHNPIINAYRSRTPDARTPDEHPLLKKDITFARQWFSRVDVHLYGLATLGAVPAIKTPLAGPLLAGGRVCDLVLLRIPGLKWWAWFSVLEFWKPR